MAFVSFLKCDLLLKPNGMYNNNNIFIYNTVGDVCRGDRGLLDEYTIQYKIYIIYRSPDRVICDVWYREGREGWLRLWEAFTFRKRTGVEEKNRLVSRRRRLLLPILWKVLLKNVNTCQEANSQPLPDHAFTMPPLLFKGPTTRIQPFQTVYGTVFATNKLYSLLLQVPAVSASL